MANEGELNFAIGCYNGQTAPGVYTINVTQDITLTVREADGRWRGQIELVPTRWGIQPFKALLGAIKLEDRVVVRFDFAVVEP